MFTKIQQPIYFRALSLTILFISVSGILYFTSGCSENPVEIPYEINPIASQSRCFYMGFTPFPFDFTIPAITETNQWIAQNGDIVAQHLEQGVPWTEALEGKPFHPKMMEDWNNRKKTCGNKKLFLSLNVLNEGRTGMELYRGASDDMPLPEAFQNKAFNDPIIKKAYLNYCQRAIEYFEPDYLAISIEANELFHHSPDQWPDYLELYKETYSKLKQQHPQLPIFATVTLHNLTNPEWDPPKHQAEIKKFLEYNDIVGISYHPFMAGQSHKPIKTFEWLKNFTDKPIAITETTFPAETIRLKSYNLTIPGSPDMQRTYIRTLLDRANQDKYLFVISFLYRDYDALWAKIKDSCPEAFVVWKDCGLYDEDGKKRPAYDEWKQYLSLTKASQ